MPPLILHLKTALERMLPLRQVLTAKVQDATLLRLYATAEGAPHESLAEVRLADTLSQFDLRKHQDTLVAQPKAGWTCHQDVVFQCRRRFPIQDWRKTEYAGKPYPGHTSKAIGRMEQGLVAIVSHKRKSFCQP